MKKSGLVIRIALLVVCAAGFVVSVITLINIFGEYSEADNFYESVNEDIEGLLNDKNNIASDEKVPERLVKLSEYVRELQQSYPDVVGYINVPNLKDGDKGISYPVVQTDNNDYYLTHMINGEENKSGSVFLDSKIDADSPNTRNLILYGHNMNNGAMFHSIEKMFSDRNLFEGAVVEYITADAVYIYSPFALYRGKASYFQFPHEFSNEEAYKSFLERIKDSSVYSTAEEANPDKNIISLVTCVNSINQNNDRYFYQAILNKSYTNIHAEAEND